MKLNRLFPVFLALGALALAQSDRARLVGTVYDASGAVIPRATVRVTDRLTQSVRETTADNRGLYVVEALLPAPYDVQGSAKDFAAALVENIRTAAGQETRVDLHLQPATVTQSVTVASGQLAQIDTSSADIAATVSSREVNDLPVNGRMVSQLYLLIPGASMSSSGTFDDVRFFGRSNEQNVIRYDGIEAGTLIDASPGDINGASTSQFRLSQSMENIQEFHVEASTYAAEYGRGTGGQVTIITKSGTNSLHGDLFEFFRNSDMDARNYFNAKGTPQAPLHLNQYGGAVGGAIIKDKLFFYLSQENLTQRVSASFSSTTLSDYARSLAVPAIQPVLAAYPKGTIHTSSPYFDVAFANLPSYVDENFGNARFDWRINDKNTAYIRYQRDQGNSFTPSDISGSGTRQGNIPQNAIVDVTTVFRPTLVNDAKVGFNGAKTRLVLQGAQVPGVDISADTFNIGGGTGLYTGTGVTTPTGAGSTPLQHANPYTNYEFEYVDNLSWIKGAHNFKTGFDIAQRFLYVDQIGGTVYTFTTVQNFLNDIPSQVSFDGTLSGSSPFFPGTSGVPEGKNQLYGFYVQDEWHLRPNLTMNYGLRYDYFSPLMEARGREINVSTVTGALELGQPPYATSKLSFGPRLAFAWSPTALQNRTVFRVGAGYYYGPGQTEDNIQPILNDVAALTLTTGNIGFPLNTAAALAAFVPGSPNASYQPRVFGANYSIPEKVLSYTASIQQTLPDQSVLTLAYVGSQGRNMFLRSITNDIVSVSMDPVTGAGIINRQFGNRYAELDVKTSGGTNYYSAMQLSWNRRFTSGLMALANYTWSTDIGTSQGSNETITSENPYTSNTERGFNTTDIRQVFNASLLWSVPMGKGHQLNFQGNRILQAVAGGWQMGGNLNVHTGLPINVTMTRANVVYYDKQDGNYYQNPVVTGGVIQTVPVINLAGGGQSRGVQRPDLIPGVNPYVNTASGYMLNPAAFAVPAPGTWGNAARDLLRGPGFQQLDFTLSKRFAITESAHFELRADAYNILNHANFGNPPSVLGVGLPTGPGGSGLQPHQAFTTAAAGSAYGLLSSTVGKYVNMGTARQVQLAIRFVF